MHYDSTYLEGKFGGWLEGNFVVGKNNQLWNILRVYQSAKNEKAAFVEVSADGLTLTFDPNTGFKDFPGGSKKFFIKYDEKSGYYYTLANIILDNYTQQFPKR